MEIASPIPVLRMYDVAATRRFYVDYLGCTLDPENVEGDGPVYLKVSRDGFRAHLSSHHDDGTRGASSWS